MCERESARHEDARHHDARKEDARQTCAEGDAMATLARPFPTKDDNAAEQRLILLLLALTLVTGLVDAVSYLGLGHVFTANMTGNVVLLGFAVAGAPHLSMARSFVSLGAFVVGALVGGRAGIALANAARERWLLAVGSSEALLLCSAAFAAIGLDAGSEVLSGRVYLVVVLTALAMGIRMSTVRRLAVPDITTTVLTTTLAGLAGESSVAGGGNPRVGRRVGSVLVMFVGASVGALLLRYGLAVPLLVSGVCVLTANLAYAQMSRIARRDEGETPRLKAAGE
jgi:uncharacterized membrane protein YoaK (UPF0700 family)